MGRFRRRVGARSGTAPGGGSPPTPAPWTPADIVGIQGWWRADLGVTKDGSDKVSAWRNQITYPALQEVTQATPAGQPTYVATHVDLGGQPAVLFSPGEGLTAAGRMPNPGTHASPSTHIVILVASGLGQISAAGNSEEGLPNFTRTLIRASHVSYAMIVGSSSGSFSADVIAPYGVASLIVGELETTSLRGISVNSESGTASWPVSGSGESDSFGLGENAGQISSVSFPAAEYAFVDRLLTAGELANLESYVTTRYGISFAPAGTPDIATLADLTWQDQSDATATQAGGAGTDIDYNTGTVETTVRGLYATVDGTSPVEIQAQATPSGAIPNHANLGVYLEDASGNVVRTLIYGANNRAKAFKGPSLASVTEIGTIRDEWDLDSVIRVFRGNTYEEFTVKDAAVFGPRHYILGRAINTDMGVPVRGGFSPMAPLFGTLSMDVTKLRIGEPEVLAAINGVPNLGSLTTRSSSSATPLTTNQPTQDQTTGVISVPSRATSLHTSGTYFPTDEAEGDLVLAVTVAPSGSSRLSAAAIFDVTGDKQRTWGPLHDGKVYLHIWTGFSPGSSSNITHAWNPTTDRVRIQVTATQLRYDLSTDSGATWTNHFTETLGSEHATPEAMGAMVFSNGVAAGVAGTITEMTWTPS